MEKYIKLNYLLLTRLFLTGSILSIFLFLVNIQRVDILSDKSLEGIFLLSFGDLNISGIKYGIPLLFWLLPMVFLLYFLGDDMASDFGRNAVYIFTRTHQRKIWFLAKSLSLFFYIFLYYFVQFFVLWIIASVYGLHLVNSEEGIFVILSMLILLILQSFIVLLMINLLALRTTQIIAYTIVFAGYIASLFFSNFLYEIQWCIGIIKWLPFTQGIFSWHNGIPSSVIAFIVTDFHLQNFSVLFSIIYQVVITTLLIILGTHKIEDMDIF
ncbi:MAG TPA: hypothetical protein DDY49_15510 [Paenibacillaceae bacterium]|nr:hypothetical protein [Paenibacillaceae bacterium]